jgi:hypothetical protein
MMTDDVRLVLSGWLEKGTPLSLVGEFLNLGVALKCKVAVLIDDQLGLSTEDGGRIQVNLSDSELISRYSEPRELPKFVAAHDLTAAQQCASAVHFLFPSRAGDDSPADEEAFESLTLMELNGKVS